jgi:putative membrane protein
MIYLMGGLLLFFVPAANLTRGGGAWLMQGALPSDSPPDFHMALGSAAVAGGVAFLLFGPMTRGVLWLMTKVGYRRISAAALVVVLMIVVVLTGWAGAVVMVTATGIGLIPVLFGSRRMNCLGIILLPIACNMSGVGAKIAGWLGLV